MALDDLLISTGVDGLIHLVKEKGTIDVPKWAGIGAIAAGVLLLVLGRKP